MQTYEPEQELEPATPRLFATTHWSVVRAAVAEESATARDALEQLCEAYWYPVYVYVRRKGYGADDAKDLTQEFFAQVIAKKHLRLADHSKGRFRSFLLASLHYFLAREWSRAHRQKRGGNYRFVSLGAELAEDRYRFEPANEDTPEKQFQRQWALAVLNNAMSALASECSAAGKAQLFHELKHLLSGEPDGPSYAEIGVRLGMKDNAVRVAVHRLRQRYAELLRGQVAQTVNSETDVQEEMKYLLQALSE